MDLEQLLDQAEQFRAKDESEIEQLTSCYKQYCDYCSTLVDTKGISNPLQHTCTNDCTWFHFSSEKCVCIQSGNLHVCTYSQCGNRAHDDEGHSVCMLTARIREEADPVTANDRTGTADHFSVSAADINKGKAKGVKGRQGKQRLHYTQDHLDAAGYIRRLLPKITEEKLNWAVGLCVRLWHIILHESPMTKDTGRGSTIPFQDHCIIVIYDMTTGYNISFPGRKIVNIIPFDQEIHDSLPPTDRLYEIKMKWETGFVKFFRASLATIPPDIWLSFNPYEVRSHINTSVTALLPVGKKLYI
jgi:hypothetical protein